MRLAVVLVMFVVLTCALSSWAEQRSMEHVIIPADRGDEFVLGHYGTAMGPHWNPTEAQVRELEARLPAFLAQAAPAGSRLSESPSRIPLRGYFRDPPGNFLRFASTT